MCGILGSCLVSCCASIVCTACCKVGRLQSTGTKLCYAFFLLLSFLLALAMLGTQVQEFVNENLAEKLWFDKGSTISDELVGTLSVTRIMTASIAFHAILSVSVAGVNDTQSNRAAIHNGLWCFKFLAWVGLICLMFVLPNGIFQGLSSTVYRGGGCLFLLISIIHLVDFVYQFYRRVYIDRGDQDTEGGWMCLVMVITFGCYAWTVFVTVTAVVVHSDGEGCGEGLAAVFLGLALTIVVSCLSVSPWVRNAANGMGQTNGIFQASVVSAYCSFLALSAMQNHPEMRCRIVKTDDVDFWLKMLGVLFVCVTVSFTAIERGTEDHAVPPLPGMEGMESEEGELEDDEKHGVKYAYWYFHLHMLLAAMYLCMLLTGWDTIEGSNNTLVLDRTMVSVWIKILTSWICYVLYAVTLILPPLFPDRQFGSPPEGGAQVAVGA